MFDCLSSNTWWKHYQNSAELPARLRATRPGLPLRLQGVVVEVVDGDTVRFVHEPWLRATAEKRNRPVRRRANTCILLRLAGVDCPESAHFGREAQPYAAEATDFVRERLMRPEQPEPSAGPSRRQQGGGDTTRASKNRQASRKENQTQTAADLRRIPHIPRATVKVTIYHIDQYGRAVGELEYPSGGRIFGSWRNLAIDLLHAGLAVVYRSRGAAYGKPRLAGFNDAETKARAAKIGLWALANFETPAEYKLRHRLLQE